MGDDVHQEAGDLHTDLDDADPDGGTLLEIDCPRCGCDFEARFYGPCPACVEHLRATCRGETRDVAAPEYVPKMNVTPNAVALKE